MEDLNYHVPPDILHYESRYLLGFTIGELMLGMGVALVGMVGLGPLSGLAMGAVALLVLRRVEVFGGRSLPFYLLALASYRWRRVRVELPRLLPLRGGRLEVYDWRGEKLFEVDER